jgi:hypothetical protein
MPFLLDSFKGVIIAQKRDLRQKRGLFFAIDTQRCGGHA